MGADVEKAKDLAERLLHEAAVLFPARVSQLLEEAAFQIIDLVRQLEGRDEGRV